MIETTRFGLVFEFPESLGKAMKTEGVQLVECGVSEHEDFLSMVVAGTTQIGVIEKRGGTAFPGRGVVRLAGEKGGDALAVEDAQFEGVGGHRFEGRRAALAVGAALLGGGGGVRSEASRIEATIRAQNAQAGAEPLFGVRPAG